MKRILSRSSLVSGYGLQLCLTICFLVSLPSLSAFAGSNGQPLPVDASVPNSRPGEEVRTGSSVELNKEYITGYWTDFKNIITSPARWDRSDWITAALVSGVSIGLYYNDTKIQKWVLDNRTKTSSDIGDNVTYLGSGYLTVGVVGGMYLYGQVAGNGKATETALLSVESFALTGVFVQVIKRTAGRHRPYTGDPYNTWGGPSLASQNDSFPSGHSSSAFAVATVIATEYDNAVVPPLAYGVAAITGYNRIQHNAHWASDVFVGAAIGYFTGKAIVASHRNGNTSPVSIAPLLDGEGPGLMLTYRF
jgi:membrane-associated phospholipid phosphatase